MTDHWFYQDLSLHVHLPTGWGAVSAEDDGQPRRADWTSCLVSSPKILQC